MKVTFFLLPGFLQIKSQPERKCSTTSDSISCSQEKYCRSYFQKELWERSAPDNHFTSASFKGPSACPGSTHPSCFFILDTCLRLCNNWKLFKMRVTSYQRQNFWDPAVSCASWMGRTLLFRVASGTKLLGVSSNHNICCSYHMLQLHILASSLTQFWNMIFKVKSSFEGPTFKKCQNLYGGSSFLNGIKLVLLKTKVCFMTLFVKQTLAMLGHLNLISNKGLYFYHIR